MKKDSATKSVAVLLVLVLCLTSCGSGQGALDPADYDWKHRSHARPGQDEIKRMGCWYTSSDIVLQGQEARMAASGDEVFKEEVKGRKAWQETEACLIKQWFPVGTPFEEYTAYFESRGFKTFAGQNREWMQFVAETGQEEVGTLGRVRFRGEFPENSFGLIKWWDSLGDRLPEEGIGALAVVPYDLVSRTIGVVVIGMVFLLQPEELLRTVTIHYDERSSDRRLVDCEVFVAISYPAGTP